MDSSRDSHSTDLQQQLHDTLSGSYAIQRELGGGGMSRVFVAREIALGRDVVIKVLPPDMAASVSVDRFRREIQTAAQLQHPHIVPVLSSGASESLLYYTMPFIDGESLRHRLERGVAFSTGEASRAWRDILDALSHAHARGVIHRDIKPDNVLLSGRHALVTDFGIARAVEAATGGDARMTATGLSLGTPAYMSPEQAAGDPNADHRADIYSAGLVMYEMLSGAAPFTGISLRELAVAQLTREPPPLIPRDPDCPRALVALVMRCLAKDPAQRPPTAEAVLTELDTFITPAPQPGVAVAHAGRRRGMLIGGAVVLVLAIAAGTWGASTRRLPFMTPAKLAHDSLRMVVLLAETKYDAADSTLATGYAEALAAEVSKDPRVLVVGRKELVQWGALQGFSPTSLTRDTIIYIAKRGRTSAVLDVSLSRAGAGYVLSAEPRGSQNNNSLGVVQAAANSAADIPNAIQSVAAQLRKRIVDAQRDLPFSSASFVLAPVKPRAIQYFMDGHPEFDKRNFVESARLYRLAVKEDSSFGAAWLQLYSSLANAGISPSERIVAISHAYRTRATMRSPIARLGVAGDYWRAVGRPDSAIVAYDSVIALLPNSDRAAVHNQGLTFNTLRRYDLSEQVYRKLIDTSYKSLGLANSNLVSALLYQGKVDEARAEIARLTSADSANVNTRQARYLLATATRAWDELEALGRTWMATPGQSARLRGLLFLRAVAANRGQIGEFNALSGQRADLLGPTEPANFLAEYLARVRIAVRVEGDAPRALAMIDSMLAEVRWEDVDPLDRPYYSMITTLAQAGDVKRAQSYADEWSRLRAPEFRMIDSLSVLEARGEIALASGDGREALRLFRLADVRGCVPCFYPTYARAYDVLEIPDSSLVWYEKFAAATYPANQMGDAYELSRTYRRLGELYEDRNEPSKAISYYSALATLWERADPVLQPTVRDLKARIGRLEARSR